MKFGEYLANKRKEREMSLRMLAKELDVSPTYLSDVENNRRNALSYENLNKIIEILKLDEEEQKILYDLAGETKDEIPADVEDFVNGNVEVIALLRKMKKEMDGDKKNEKKYNTIQK